MTGQIIIGEGQSRIKELKDPRDSFLNWLVIPSSIISSFPIPQGYVPFLQGQVFVPIWGNWCSLPATELPTGPSERFLAISLRFNFSLCPVLLHSPFIGLDLEYVPPKHHVYANFRASESFPRELVLQLGLLRKWVIICPKNLMRGAGTSMLNVLKGTELVCDHAFLWNISACLKQDRRVV